MESGLEASFAFDLDEHPVIAYIDGSVKVLTCSNPSCSENITLASIGRGAQPAIAIGPDGLTIIAYYYYGNRDLKVAKCVTPSCEPITGVLEPKTFSEEHWTLTAIGAGDVYLIRESPSILLSPEGLPVISYTAETGETHPRKPERPLYGPKLIVCGDHACSEHAPIMLGTTGFDSGSVLAVGNDSLPLVLYRFYNGDM